MTQHSNLTQSILKRTTNISRIIIGLLFIYSGYVKLVDPIGTAIKFTEYFSKDVLNLTFLTPYVLPLSILLILVELILGVMILIGYKPKLSVRGVAALIIVFLFLTWYSAYFDKVTDCGCFGDAVKLSAWATFYKNVFFSVLVIIMLFGLHYIKPWFGKTLTNWIPFITLFLGLFISYYVLQHLPIHDFRPFAIGNSIPEGMQDVAGEDFPPIHDFILEKPDFEATEIDESEDVTDTVLQADKVLLIICYNLYESDYESFESIKNLADKAIENNYLVYMLTASYVDDFIALKEEYQLPFDMLYADETVLKTIIRANPGLMTLKKGVITGKWNWHDNKNTLTFVEK